MNFFILITQVIHLEYYNIMIHSLQFLYNLNTELYDIRAHTMACNKSLIYNTLYYNRRKQTYLTL